ncbi:MAG: hypothetical protein JRJ45_00120 [Deltaproteobacteria bacterium]|nr:hypothetical protein [Deltaproteobacteria bacterium]
MSKSVKVIVTLSEQDLCDMQDDRVFEWKWKDENGNPVDLVIGKGVSCMLCGEEFIPDGIQNECTECLGKVV